MALLTGDLASQVFAAFKGKLLKGIIRQTVIPESGALDSHGDPIDSDPVDTAIEGFFENYDDAYKARAGIPLNDLQVNIFAKSCPGVTPTKDDVVKLIGTGGVAVWYQLRKVKTDPATAMWVCQSFVIPEPS